MMRSKNSPRSKTVENVLKLLAVRPLSASDFSRELKLTKPGISKVLKEISGEKLIEVFRYNDNENRKGPKKTYYRIAKKSGMIGIIEFMSTTIRYSFTSLNGEKLFQNEIKDAEFISQENIQALNDNFYQDSEVLIKKGYRLLTIVISTPGRINKFAEEISDSKKFINIKEFKIREYYTNRYKIPVHISNDINLLLLGEESGGAISETMEDAIVIYIDSGIGGAILNKGKIIEGELGFAGEFGLCLTRDYDNQPIYVDQMCSTNSLKQKLNLRHFSDVVKVYHEDAQVRDVVNVTANRVGELIVNLYNTLNITHVFIAGRIRLLGDEYLHHVRTKVAEYNNEIIVDYTRLNDEAFYLGALSLGKAYAFRDLSRGKKNETN